MFRFRYLSLLLLLSACNQPTARTPQVDPAELASERQMQEDMIAQAQANGGTPKVWRHGGYTQKKFEDIAGRVEESGATICREMGLADQGCYYYFRIKEDADDLNAYADGDNIVITRGMLRFVENDDELALILSHELAHNLMGHHDSKMMNSLAGGAIGLLADVAAAYGGVNTQGGFMRTGMDAGGVAYSVSFEQEADYVGSYIAARAKYNPAHGAALWRRMSQVDPRTATGGITHPSNPERFIALQKTLDEIQDKQKRHVPLLPEFKPET